MSFLTKIAFVALSSCTNAQFTAGFLPDQTGATSSLRRPGSNFRLLHLEYVEHRVSLGQEFLQVLVLFPAYHSYRAAFSRVGLALECGRPDSQRGFDVLALEPDPALHCAREKVVCFFLLGRIEKDCRRNSYGLFCRPSI
jgi:hypothetical protein